MQSSPPISTDQFLEIFRCARITAAFRVPLSLDCGPALIGQIRGAWGARLLRTADKGDAEAQIILARFFAKSDNSQKPFAISADESGGNLTVTLSLFGWQDAVRDAVFDSFIAALSQDGLLIHDGTSKKKIMLILCNVHWDVATGLARPAGIDLVRMKFLTPLKIGPAGTIGMRYSDIWISAAKRAQAIAHWHGCNLTLALGDIRKLGKAMHYDDRALISSRWERWSSRSRGGPRHMIGLSGELRISGWRSELCSLRILAETMHVGADTVFGLGRFESYC